MEHSLSERLKQGIVTAMTAYRGACFDGVGDPLNCVVPVVHDATTLQVITLLSSAIDVVRAKIEDVPHMGKSVVIIRAGPIMLKKACSALEAAYPGVVFLSTNEVLAYADGWPRVLPSRISLLRDPSALRDALYLCGMLPAEVPFLPKMYIGDHAARMLGARVGDVVRYRDAAALLFTVCASLRVIVEGSVMGGAGGAEAGDASDAEAPE